MKSSKSNQACLVSKVSIPGLSKELKRLKNRMTIGNLSPASIVSYTRSVSKLSIFHELSPRDMELDQVLDFLVYLKEEEGLQ